jgi:hypothetical protein
MILFRKYGKTIEITETQKEPSNSIRRISSSVKDRSIIAIRRVDSVRRTKRICLRKLLSAIEVFGSPLFITLTFEGSASDVFLCSKYLSDFFRRLRVEFPLSHCLVVPELSPRGRIHFHGLIFNVSQEWGDVKKGKRVISYGREREERKFKNLWRVGFVDVLQTDGSPRVATYVAKYVSKTVLEPFLAPLRLVRTTIGFPNCIEIRELSMVQLDRAYKFKDLKPAYQSECYSPFLGNIKKTFYNM